MEYVTIREEGERLTVGPDARVLYSYRRFTIGQCAFGIALSLAVLWAGLIARSEPHPWSVYAYFLMFPIYSFVGTLRLTSLLRHGDVFHFDRHDGSVWHNAKRLTEGDRLRAIQIKSGWGWRGWPDVWLVFERRRPIRVLCAPYLAMALNLPGLEPIARLRPAAATEVLAAARRIARHMGVGVEEDLALGVSSPLSARQLRDGGV